MTKQGSANKEEMITIYTIGFTKKSAEEFFGLLRNAGVKMVVDIRLKNESQLAGFTKKDDLAFFLKSLAGICYVHRPELAPSAEILTDYKKKTIKWDEYERRFRELMQERKAETGVERVNMDKACLLCSEPKADKCHRRLVAEYLKSKWNNVGIHHL